MIFFFLLMGLLLLVIVSLGTGLLVGLATVPLLYFTGYGFLPVHRMPAYGGTFRSSVAVHIVAGTLVFGALSTGVALTAFLPVGIKETASLMLLLGVPSVALLGAVGLSESTSRPSILRRIAPLLVVWYGYPLVVFIPLLLIGLSQGWATYSG